ncbi:MAG: 3-oxoacyl-[acyl-carrier-protein] synthase-3 [Hyphomicrobiaceae bacterium]|jgi:3-oxoacyl-[acyl-carrier-protein] synthase-3
MVRKAFGMRPLDFHDTESTRETPGVDTFLLGTGSALPTQIIDSAVLEERLDLAPGALVDAFQVKSRHWSRPLDGRRPVAGEACSDLAAEAGRRALESCGLAPRDIDLLVVASSTPDFINPSLDYLVGAKLGLGSCLRFTIQAPCTGLFRSLVLVDALLRVGRAHNALVIAAETISPFFSLDATGPLDQRLSAGLYADGAGAVVVSSQGDRGRLLFAESTTHFSEDPPGIFFPGRLSARPDGPADGSLRDEVGYQDFRRVLRRGGELTARAVRIGLDRARWSASAVDKFLTHQATGGIKRIADLHGLPGEKFPVNIGHVGNTISASILILMDELAREESFTSGERIILATAESSSWSSGSAAVIW